MISEAFLLKPFRGYEIPPFPCPTCGASLILRNKGIEFDQNAQSRVEYEDASCLEMVYGIFTLRLVCSQNVCKEAVISSGLSVGIVNGGATMEEEKEFPIPAKKMYNEIFTELEKIPLIDLESVKNEEIPELFWLEGVFGGSQSSIISGSETRARSDIFMYQNAIGKPTRTMPLVTNDAYFVSGYDQIAKHGWALTCGFGIQARMLNRLLCLDKHQPIAAPMVIIKTSNNVMPLERK